MKKLFLFAIALIAFAAQAQNTWIQKADVGGYDRRESVGFSIGNFGYIGTGSGSPTDFWQYDPTSDVWTQKADFGGGERENAVGFSIGDKGYLGTGVWTGLKKDFWEYDPATNAWTQKADFGGIARNEAVGFSIGSKGYIGTGYTGYYQKDFWEYDPATNAWTQKADFGGEARSLAVGFSIGSKGYIGTGVKSSFKKDFWEFDPVTNTWSQKADFGGTGRYGAVGFSIGSKGYIGTGNDSIYGSKKDFWEYDPATNVWNQKADFGGTARAYAVGFSIVSKGYIGTGYDVAFNFKKDFWEYTPDCLNVTTYYADADGDGFGNLALYNCGALPGYVTNNSDCNDANASINTAATEICGNGIDDNCNGLMDENLTIPIGLATTNITSTSAQLNWHSVTVATKYKVKYKQTGIGAPWTNKTVTPPDTSTILTGLLPNTKYNWKVRSTCGGGVQSDFSSTVKFTTLLRLGNEQATDAMAIYPNPIITSGTISFSLEQTASVNIGLVDVTGRKLQTVLDKNLDAGNHEVKFNREQVAAGIYFLQIKMNEETNVLKVVIQ